MTCMECINYDVCSTSSVNCDRGSNHCAMFKDKSKYIELPCKVGDMLYRIKIVNGTATITTTTLNKNTFWRIIFGGDFGKTVFLTREEAEAFNISPL